MAFNAMMIEQSDVVRGYTLTIFFFMITVWSSYRYRRVPHMGWILVYFLSASFALLCEFAAVDVMVFAALYLLYGIVRQSPLPRLHLALYVLIHLTFLAYLLSFTYFVNSIGEFKDVQTMYFALRANFPPLYNAAKLVWHYVNLISGGSFTILLASSWGSEPLGVVSFIVFFVFCLTGSVWLARNRYGWLLLWVALSIAIYAALIEFKIMPFDIGRHSIGFMLPYMMLLYGGVAHLFENIRWRPRPVPMVLVCTAILSAGYACYGWNLRMYRPYEFQQTREQANELFAFLDAHVSKDDIILTDPSSAYHFWRHWGHCRMVPATNDIFKYSCYKAPVFIKNEDMRADDSQLDLPGMQTSLLNVYHIGNFSHVRNVWLVTLQHADGKMSALNPDYKKVVDDRMPLALQKQYAAQVKTILAEQVAFVRYAYNQAVFKKVTYAYPCGVADDQVQFDVDTGCMMNFIAVALPAGDIEKWMIHHPPYHELMDLVNRKE